MGDNCQNLHCRRNCLIRFTTIYWWIRIILYLMIVLICLNAGKWRWPVAWPGARATDWCEMVRTPRARAYQLPAPVPCSPPRRHATLIAALQQLICSINCNEWCSPGPAARPAISSDNKISSHCCSAATNTLNFKLCRSLLTDNERVKNAKTS